MQVGDLVMMKEDCFKIMGVIVDIIVDNYEDIEVYKIFWMDDLCDVSYTTKESLEEVCKLVT